MKTLLTLLLLGTFCSLFAQTTLPPRLDRAHSYFGLHFDFHAGPDCKEVGKNVDASMVNNLIDKVKPDFIQVDCKGHPGYSSYPTKVGNPVPGFSKDQLMIWRQVTASRGVALYLHYSGVWDSRAIELHPQWAAIGADGTPSKNNTSVFGNYADSLLIPQLKELSSVYGVDGVWVDGDCWAHQLDYAPKTLALFTQKTGLNEIPRKAGDVNWKEFLQFGRDGFKAYVTKYVTALHAANPKFQVASNWAFSTLMPEPVSIPVDFISGDFSALNSINSARSEARFIRNQGKPWDLMAWGFSWMGNEEGTQCVKSAVQIERELASVISLGGGVQIYLQQKRDGSIHNWMIPLLSDAAKFCRERQPWCQNAVGVPQIGLILSTNALYAKTNRLFGGFDKELTPLKGILQNLLSSQYVVDIVAEHHLTDINKYPLLIYPEWETISPDFKQKLLNYVSQGGKLLLIGPNSASLFKDELHVTLQATPVVKNNGLACNGWIAELMSLSQGVIPGKDVVSFGKYYQAVNMDGPSETAATITKYGKGEIAATYLELGKASAIRSAPVLRDFLASLVKEIFSEPLVTVTGSRNVDVTLNRKAGAMIVNLVNAAGPHENEKVLAFDEIPQVGPLEITLRQSEKPKKVMLQPANIPLPYSYRDGKVQCSVPLLKIHEMVVVE
ncbi:MAG: alpha-L-fucosidase [Bacteroidia bacterium]|nr:alpha-L-fucosidase [Bacteroidia bacterium]